MEVLLGGELRAVQRHRMIGAGVEHREQHEVLHPGVDGGADEVAIAVVVDLLRPCTATPEEAVHRRDHARGALHRGSQGGRVPDIADRDLDAGPAT